MPCMLRILGLLHFLYWRVWLFASSEWTADPHYAQARLLV